jgi:hypothetical protein
MKTFAEISEDMIASLEKDLWSYKLNYHAIKAIKEARKVGVIFTLFNNTFNTFILFNNKLYKLLNYFNIFKYEITSNADNTLIN